MNRDLSLPVPLTSPDSWLLAAGELKQPLILSLDFGASIAGPAFDVYVKLAQHAGIWRYTPGLYKKISTGIEIEKAEFLLRQSESVRLLSLERVGMFQEFGVEVSGVEREDLLAQTPGTNDWIEAISPGLLGEHLDEVLLKRFAKESGELTGFGWFDLRYFAGFLRKNGRVREAEIFHSSQAHLECLFSPHDEARLKPERNHVILNPTLQTVRLDATARELRAFARFQGKVGKKALSWQQALLIDEIMEEGEMSSSALLHKAMAKSAEISKLGEKISLKSDELSQALQELATDHFVLMNS